MVRHMDKQLNHSSFNLFVSEAFWKEQQSNKKGCIGIPINEVECNLR